MWETDIATSSSRCPAWSIAAQAQEDLAMRALQFIEIRRAHVERRAQNFCSALCELFNHNAVTRVIEVERRVATGIRVLSTQQFLLPLDHLRDVGAIAAILLHFRQRSVGALQESAIGGHDIRRDSRLQRGVEFRQRVAKCEWRFFELAANLRVQTREDLRTFGNDAEVSLRRWTPLNLGDSL